MLYVYRDDIKQNIIFGFMDNDDDHAVLNFVFIYAKYYIFVLKQDNNNKIELYNFLPRLSFSIKKELAKTTMLEMKYLVKLRRLYDILNP